MFNSQYGWQPQVTTNIVTVTSLEEAIMRSTTRNSDMTYFHQDQNVFYRVKVDMEGRKTWAQFNYSTPDPNLNVPATRADIEALAARLSKLEAKNGNVEVTNVEFNGPNNISTSKSTECESN